MSYRRDRSRVVVGAGLGLGAWLVGTLLVSIALLVVGFAPAGGSPLAVTAAYPLAVLWFVAILAGGLTPLVVVLGAVTSGLLAGAGAVAAAVADPAEPRDGIGVGLAVAAGHGLAVAVVLAWIGPIGIAAQSPAGRTFTLAFGGFVVPAALAVVGAVGTIQFRD